MTTNKFCNSRKDSKDNKNTLCLSPKCTARERTR